MTRAENLGVVARMGHSVRLDFDTQTVHVDDWSPMTVGEFMMYVTGLEEGLQRKQEDCR